MQFVSYTFPTFLCFFILGYYTFFKRVQWQFLLVGSLLFYYGFGKVGLFYILGMAGVVFFSALQINRFPKEIGEWKKEVLKEDSRHLKRAKKRWLYFGVFISLSLLIITKYGYFIFDPAKGLWSGSLGRQRFGTMDFMIPMGLSFYTLKCLGYLFDVFRGKYPAEKNFWKFTLFVAFFPQVIQGPISRYDVLAETLFERHDFNYRRLIRGFYRLLWGYFKKLVIADRIAVPLAIMVSDVDTYYGAYTFLILLLYSIQLYADFTGGIDIAIAVGEMLGISMEENFLHPYFSKSVKEYWRRWHITMGAWFTEYVFYPLSVTKPMLHLSKMARKKLGKKFGRRVPIYISTLSVWVLTGLWHGIGWNFVVWGLLNGIFILISEERKALHPLFYGLASTRMRKGIIDTLSIVRTLFLIGSFRILDLYPKVSFAFYRYLSIFTAKNWNLIKFKEIGLAIPQLLVLGFSIVMVFGVSLRNQRGDVRDAILAKQEGYWYLGIFWLILLILIFGVYGIDYDSSRFIYERF